MSRRNGYWERDSRGHERVVIINRGRSSSHSKSTRELLQEAEEREQALMSQIASLHTRLSFSERKEWNLRQEHVALVHEHQSCRPLRTQLNAHINDAQRLHGILLVEEDKNEKLKDKIKTLEEKIRLLKRNVVPDYRGRYETAMKDLDLLTQRIGEKNDELRLKDLRIEEKGRTIVYLKDYLQRLGYTVR